MPPSRYIQYENAFSRGNATSRAPIISGTRKFPKPARIGTITRKIIVVPCIVRTSLYVFFVSTLSFGVASCARINTASRPPTTKKTSAVAMYMIPIRLWSTVTIHRATRPFFQEGLAATCARSLEDLRLRVPDERLDLRVAPALSDGRHLAEPVAHDRRQSRWLHEQRIRRHARPVRALPLPPVAGRAHAVELRPSEVLLRRRAHVGLVFGCARRDHTRAHRFVERPAELGALADVRARPIGLEPRVIRPARDRIGLAAELRDPPAVAHVRGAHGQVRVRRVRELRREASVRGNGDPGRREDGDCHQEEQQELPAHATGIL